MLTDGASSTYGTDAIAGVINFITRKEYKGIAVGAEVQLPEEGGGELYTANSSAAGADLAKDRWNVYGGLNVRQQKPMGGNERDFSVTSFIPSRGFNNTERDDVPGESTAAGRGLRAAGHRFEHQPLSARLLASPRSINTGPAPIGNGRQ